MRKVPIYFDDIDLDDPSCDSEFTDRVVSDLVQRGDGNVDFLNEYILYTMEEYEAGKSLTPYELTLGFYMDKGWVE